METKNVLSGIVSLAVVVICVATIMVPVIEDAKLTAGAEVSYSNSQNSTNTYYYDYVDSLDFSATYDDTNSVWEITVNEQEITPISDSMLAIVSDGLSMQITTNGANINYWKDGSTSKYVFASSDGTVTVNFENGTWTLIGVGSGYEESGTYSWVVTYVENGEYIARNGNPTNFYTTGQAEDFILYGGLYSTGELDTYYAYGDGAVTLGVETYTGTVNLTTTLVDGTTDVYQCTACNLTVTDTESDASETFTPYRCLVKQTVTGHESSGAAYSLYGAIPVIVIAALVIASIGMVVTKRD